MKTKVYWAATIWPGKLGLSARPRGGDWLADEIADWKRQDVSNVVSLLTSDEEQDLDLTEESREVEKSGMAFTSFPIPDRGVPPSQTQLDETLSTIDAQLSAGENVLVHCRQGIGRTGLVAACLLIAKGLNPPEALRRLTLARGIPVPETEEQRKWIEQYATSLALSK